MYTYNVKKQYGRGSESGVASFNELSDAKAFVRMKLDIDVGMNVQVTYRIYQYDELVQESNTETHAASSSDTGGQSQSSGARFNPTPFNTTPKPAGSPQNWTTNGDEEDKK